MLNFIAILIFISNVWLWFGLGSYLELITSDPEWWHVPYILTSVFITFSTTEGYIYYIKNKK